MALLHKFELSEAEAWPIFAAWNQTNALPHWKEPELRKLLADAARKVGGGTRPIPIAATPRRCEPPPPEKRPVLRHPTLAEIEQIAALRKVRPEAVYMLALEGLLFTAHFRGQRCFAIHEGNFTQFRRMDGAKFRSGGMTESKTFNLKGSTATFIGKRRLGQGTPVLLVEGPVGILEAVSAALEVDADARGWTVIAASSAHVTMGHEWLRLLAGHYVRILPDNDPAGHKAVGQWSATLRRAGISTSGFHLPEEFKDLGPVVERADLHLSLISEIFTVPSHA